jgi:peptidoglycan/xylan/chitin deacetylase (PgdA/CDA1 family)
MSTSVKVKSVLASLLHRAGVHSWRLRPHAAADTAILMYHRVIPRSERDPSVQAGMVVEPDTLDLHLRTLRAHFEIVPLSDLVTPSHGGSRRKPRCVLTFDDGWYDFYRHAYPVLAKHEAPAAVFLPTDFVGTERWFWTDRLGLLLSRLADPRDGAGDASPSGDPLVEALVGASGTQAARLEKAITLLKPHGLERIECVLAELDSRADGAKAPVGRAFLTWVEVREMAASGLVSFGSHTAGHPLLTTLTEEQARHELRKSMRDLIAQQVASPGFVAFSYPNGDYSPRLGEMVREAGYHLAVVTRHGWHGAGADPYAMPRIAVHQDIASTEAMLLSRIGGLW